MRQFQLRRLVDESGVSGTGIVAVGVEFPTGRCVMEWLIPPHNLGVYASVEALERTHGHGGKTLVEWL